MKLKLYFKPILLELPIDPGDDPGTGYGSQIIGPVNENTRLAPAIDAPLSDNVFADTEVATGLAPMEFVDATIPAEGE